MATQAHTSTDSKAVSLSHRTNRSSEKERESSKLLLTSNLLFLGRLVVVLTEVLGSVVLAPRELRPRNRGRKELVQGGAAARGATLAARQVVPYVQILNLGLNRSVRFP
jgi:hypothetical protein